MGGRHRGGVFLLSFSDARTAPRALYDLHSPLASELAARGTSVQTWSVKSMTSAQPLPKPRVSASKTRSSSFRSNLQLALSFILGLFSSTDLRSFLLKN